MLFSRIFEFSNRKLIRRLNSLSPDIVSSIIRAKVSIPTTEHFASLIQKKEVRINHWKNERVNGTNQILIYPSDLDSFTKICSNNNLFVADTVKQSGTLIIPNRLSILLTNGIAEKLRTWLDRHPNFSYNLLGQKICHLFCNNSEDFNSLFFMNNGSGLDIKRTVFPYIYKTTLKLTPNILSVVLPPDVDTVIKAANIFSAYGFNRISKPNSTGSWLFYLQNETDYMKMLSTPNYYLGKVLPVMPYYGTPLIYTPGEKEAGKIIHIYHNNPIKTERANIQYKNFFNFYSNKFENQIVDSYYFTNVEDFNALKFSNGLDLYNGHKYTMVIGDEVSSENINSPYLGMKIKTDSESQSILKKIQDMISYHKIIKLGQNTFLDIIPKSLVDYKNLLNTKFECENNSSNYFVPLSFIPKGSLLLNSFLIDEKFYNENKFKLDNNKDIILKKIDTGNYIVAFEQNKAGDVLFYLSNISPGFQYIRRSYKRLYKFDNKEVISSMKCIVVPKSKLSSLLAKITTVVPVTRDHPYYNDMHLLHFEDVSTAYPFLFRDYFEENGKRIDSLDRLKVRSDKSVLIVYHSSKIKDSDASLIHNLNLVPLPSKDNSIYYHVKMESLHDYANALSFCDSLGGYQNIRFIPGNDLLSL